jgi:tRNA A37 N6-isopentenylltransferase MiaA
MDSVGVRELSMYLSGTLTLEQAEDRISTRTRRFARRQMRWFDKLIRTLEGRAKITVLQNSRQASNLHTMHDIIGV